MKLLKLNVETYHNSKIIMAVSEFAMNIGVDPSNLTRPTIGGVCVGKAITLRTRHEQHFLDQLDQVLNTSSSSSFVLKWLFFRVQKSHDLY
jgi:hypothetical protein